MTKADIFSGFLGAGKTTLIKKLIAEAYKGEKLVLIENEFGDIGIDGGFMKEAGIEVNEMNSGCICCSLVGDFHDALTKVLSEFRPDRILIEPSGVGKLSDIIRAVEGVEGIEINSATAVADASKCRMYAKNFGEFYDDQIRHAGAIVLSRTDSISAEKLDKCVELLRERNPDAVIITTPWSELSGKDIQAAIERTETLEKELEELSCGHEHDDDECGCEHEHHHEHEHEHHHHDDECGCGHEHHHHGHDADEVFISWGVETPKKFTAVQLEKILADLDESSTYGAVLRAKGIVDAEDGQWLHFDHVPGEVNVRRGPAAVTGRLCVIGSGLNTEALKALFGV
jgi:G3E family GTPase